MWYQSKIIGWESKSFADASQSAVLISFTAVVAFLAAWWERFDYCDLNLWQLKHFGWYVIVPICLLLVVYALAKRLTVWAAVAALVTLTSLFVDDLPLRALGKAQLAMALLGLAQWASRQDQAAPLPLAVLTQMACTVAAVVIESAYFFALLRNHNYVGVF